jgi:hypothetical protein
MEEVSGSESESSVERKLTWRTDSQVRPGKTIHCESFAQVGNFDGGYTSQVDVELADGRTFSFTEKGRLEAVSWAQATSSCSEVGNVTRRDPPSRRVPRGVLGGDVRL